MLTQQTKFKQHNTIRQQISIRINTSISKFKQVQYIVYNC